MHYVRPLPNSSPYKCEPCNQTFPFPLKYRQHIAGRPHKLFVRSLVIHPTTSTPNANEEAGISDSETSEDMYDVVLTLRTKLKIWLLEDLFEEMNDRAGKAMEVIFLFLQRSSHCVLAGKQSAHPM